MTDVHRKSILKESDIKIPPPLRHIDIATTAQGKYQFPFEKIRKLL